ncbi:Rv2231c family pyridoxal phosphate-dependent protein CobC [Sphaerimonospora mesophila]|uniref:Rv2231c family pyridoxal phosphate-dependent protein CobC n=1 Tax=Sphaerimonospora mesophila TaxID=37483 RepID=UPI0006E2E431
MNAATTPATGHDLGHGDYDLRHHGDAEAVPGMLDFAVNVRLTAPPEWLRAVLVDALGTLGRYPDAGAATAAAAARHGRPVDEVLPTAGAAEAFVLLARALRPRRAVCVHPSFTEPEAALRAAGHAVERVVLPEPYGLRPEPASAGSIPADLIPADADLVVLGNPTNPTGVLHDPADLVRLARPGRILVVDEAFIDTVPGERGSLAARRDVPGLVVVRSLTKTWGLAGLRVGYVLAEPAMVRTLARAQPLWSVSTPALAALVACCSPAALAEADRAAALLGEHRTRLVAGLAELGIEVAAPSSASFVLVRTAGGLDVRERLRAAGIAVRRADTFPGLGPDHLRIAVRPPALTDRLLTELASVIAGASAPALPDRA